MKLRWWLPLLLIALVACHSSAPPPVADHPTRIVSMLPSFTQILVAMGAGDRIVGHTSFCPAEGVRDDAVVIGAALNANFEKIVAVRADLVVAQDTMEEHVNKLRALGLQVEPLPAETIDHACNAAVRLGQLLGLETEGRQVAADMRGGLDAVRRSVARQKLVRALMVVGHTPGELRDITVAAGKTFLNELLQVAGGINVAADAPALYPKYSTEEILRANPEVIFIFVPQIKPDPQTAPRELALWRTLSYLQAMKQNRVHVITDRFALSPGTDMAATAKKMAALLHPETP
ncbi:MAG: helical backbone metal receptor [Candidatus Lernaella stagnicola]|nr:helical backbone metal receptor [Candidatus Lernaella stagnicola]